MRKEFRGTFSQLKKIVYEAGILGQWKTSGGKHSLRTYYGCILNFWPSTGTINFQGKEVGMSILESSVNLALKSSESSVRKPLTVKVQAVQTQTVKSKAVKGKAVKGKAVKGKAVKGKAVKGKAVKGKAIPQADTDARCQDLVCETCGRPIITID